MAGFPQRPQRAAFGATKAMPIGRVIQNERVELGPDPMNLLFDQAVGLGMVAPLVVAVIDPSLTGADAITYLATLNDQELGFEIIVVSATVMRLRCTREGIPNETGASTTVALAQAAPDPIPLSLRLVSTMAAEAQFQTAAALDSGARVEVDVTPGGTYVDIDCTRVDQSAWLPFVVTGWARNGSSS